MLGRGSAMASQGLIRSNQGSFNSAYRLADVLIVLLCLVLALSSITLYDPFEYMTVGLVASIIYLLFGESLQLYRSWRGSSLFRMLSLTTTAWVLACVVILTISFFAKLSEEYSRLVIGIWMITSLIALNLWRMLLREIMRTARQRGYNTRRVAIVGINDAAMEMRRQLMSNKELGYQFSGFYDDRSCDRVLEQFPDATLEGSIAELLELTRKGKLQTIFIALPLKAQKRINEILQKCGDTTANVHLIPDFFTYNLLNARLYEIGDMQTLSVYDSPMLGNNDVLKRLFDILFSGAVLIVIALPMMVIAVAIKATSRGPVIFKQNRYGLDGRQIIVWKFRSMTTMDNGDKVVQATKGDSRITPLGAILRSTSLDELPQFVNVLQGRMSVVGPRPHAVAHNEEYRKLIPYYMLRHKVKPGITGWAQINGFRGETSTLDKMEGRVEHDLEYIRNWSLWMDIKIVFLTFFKGFTGNNVH